MTVLTKTNYKIQVLNVSRKVLKNTSIYDNIHNLSGYILYFDVIILICCDITQH